MQLHYESYRLKFRYPFTISKGTKTHQPMLMVQLTLGPWTGYGEAPAITYYNITVEQMIEDLESKRNLVEKFAFTDAERFWHYLHHLFPNNPFLVAALDMAGWDLLGKMKGLPLWKIWGGQMLDTPFCDYTIGIDSTDMMVKKMKEKPWPIYKIKVGTANDIAIVKALRAETKSRLRVDANAGWDLETAIQLLPLLKQEGVELIEQPLAKDNWEGMKILYGKSDIPLYADESCVSEGDVEKCEGYFHGINIKLTKCSGLTPARRMINNAHERGMKVMVGSMNESTIGSAAIGQLLPFIEEVDMDGPLLLEEDIATGVDYDLGKVTVSPSPGLGIRFTGLYQKLLV